MFQDALHEQDHFILLNRTVAVLVNSDERFIELRLIKVVVQGQVFECFLQERPCLLLFKLVIRVGIEFSPDLINDSYEHTIAFNLRSHSVAESLVCSEERVVNEHLNVAREALPYDRVLVAKGFAINHDHLLALLRRDRSCSLSVLSLSTVFSWFIRSDLEILLRNILIGHIDADLATTHVLRVSFIDLDATATTGIRHDTGYTHSTLPVRVIDPGDVDQAIINGREWINDHASTGELAVVDHHESRADASLVKWLVVNR